MPPATGVPLQAREDRAAPRSRDYSGQNTRGVLACSLLLAVGLTLAIPGSSLWTDEAFSAWIVSHASTGAVAKTLLAGDSSDLQMALYYFYLFFWTKLFGAGEWALRAANIPLIALFSFALVQTSWTVFRSRTAWIAAGLCPFVWYYAAEARPYMALLTFSTVACGALLAFTSGASRPKALPWITLSCIAAGALSHMLFLLALPPLAAIAASSQLPKARWREWKVPLIAFTPVFLGIAAFFAFTFVRGTSYPYPKPGFRQLFSLAYGVSGLNTYGPNRTFSLDPHPYLLPLALGGGLLVCAAVCAFVSLLQGGRNSHLRSLGYAAAIGVLEVPTVEAVIGSQLDARHLAAVLPVFLFFIMATLSGGVSRPRRLAWALFCGAWLMGDIRQATLTDYAREDYRDAVATAIRLQKETGAEMVVAADSAGAAFYGLEVQGPPPCIPMESDCASAYSQVPWQRLTTALMAERWGRSDIDAWFASLRQRGIPGLVIVQLSRARSGSPWQPMLRAKGVARSERIHGFELYLIQ